MAAPAGRIVIKGADYEPHDYTACVRITDGSGAAAAGQKVSYRVDGGAYREGITDGEGILRVTVSDGAHGIRLDDGQKDVYVDNYTGIGLVEDGIRSFPTLKITEEGGQTEEKLPFSDVEEDAWYYDAVSFADEKGLMQGSGGMFYPEQNTSPGHDRHGALETGGKSGGRKRCAIYRYRERRLLCGSSRLGRGGRDCGGNSSGYLPPG